MRVSGTADDLSYSQLNETDRLLLQLASVSLIDVGILIDTVDTEKGKYARVRSSKIMDGQFLIYEGVELVNIGNGDAGIGVSPASGNTVLVLTPLSGMRSVTEQKVAVGSLFPGYGSKGIIISSPNQRKGGVVLGSDGAVSIESGDSSIAVTPGNEIAIRSGDCEVVKDGIDGFYSRYGVCYKEGRIDGLLQQWEVIDPEVTRYMERKETGEVSLGLFSYGGNEDLLKDLSAWEDWLLHWNAKPDGTVSKLRKDADGNVLQETVSNPDGSISHKMMDSGGVVRVEYTNDNAGEIAIKLSDSKVEITVNPDGNIGVKTAGTAAVEITGATEATFKDAVTATFEGKVTGDFKDAVDCSVGGMTTWNANGQTIEVTCEAFNVTCSKATFDGAMSVSKAFDAAGKNLTADL